jgi:hypothetical protein
VNEISFFILTLWSRATNSAGTGWFNKSAYINVTAPTLTALIEDSTNQATITNANVSLTTGLPQRRHMRMHRP